MWLARATFLALTSDYSNSSNLSRNNVAHSTYIGEQCRFMFVHLLKGQCNHQGTGMWGHPGTHSRIEDSKTAQRFVDVMLNHGHVGIDTAQNYGNGTSEKVSITMGW